MTDVLPLTALGVRATSAMQRAARRAAVLARVQVMCTRVLRCGPVRDISATDRFVALGADSIDMVPLTCAAEEEFGIAVADDDAAQCASASATVGDMADLVLRLIDEQLGDFAMEGTS